METSASFEARSAPLPYPTRLVESSSLGALSVAKFPVPVSAMRS
jgi:hypothetical protein